MGSIVQPTALAALTLFTGVALAQPAPYPNKPIRLIVGFAPGGAADLLGRLTAQGLSEAIGQQVVVDNRAGAGSLIATELAARATPDGYTLMFTSPPHAINPALYRKAKYDPIKDFDPVVQAVSTALVLAVNPSLPFKTLADLVSFARANPGKLTYGSGGSGATGHLAMELLKSAARIDILHVPYKGTGPVLGDVMAGQINMTIGSAAPTLPQVRAGKVRALAVTGAKRSAVMPEIPTVAESGFSGFDVSQWFGILAPAGTPRAVIERLNTAMNQALERREVRERFLASSAEPVGGPPSVLGQVIAQEVPKWGKLVRSLDLRVD